jgi:hypothetical protein
MPRLIRIALVASLALSARPQQEQYIQTEANALMRTGGWPSAKRIRSAVGTLCTGHTDGFVTATMVLSLRAIVNLWLEFWPTIGTVCLVWTRYLGRMPHSEPLSFDTLM